nr:transposase [Micromonospora arborensis]
MALHLRSQELSLRDIAARLVITKGKKKGTAPVSRDDPEAASRTRRSDHRGSATRLTRLIRCFCAGNYWQAYYRANKLWSGSYFAGSVDGAPLNVVKQYIEKQNRPGQGTTQT